MGRTAPSALRFLAHRNPFDRGRWPMLSALTGDARCRDWLAGLENPTKTRRGFRVFTLAGDLTSDWIKLHGQHETGTERFMLRHLRPGSTFLDIGANIGYFSLLAAVTGGASAVSFEPQRPIAQLLLKSAAQNGVSERVRVEQLALSNAPGTARMTSCPGNTGHSRLAGAGDGDVEPYPVPVATLDDWLRENPSGKVSVCKIDTEGAELRVLEGMRQLLDRDGPAIVVEVIEGSLAGFGASGTEVVDLLGRHGYTDVTGRYAFFGDSNRYFVHTRGAEPAARR
jgi:FkbM family methyltransferase